LLVLGAFALLVPTAASLAKSSASETWICTLTDSAGIGPTTAAGPIPFVRELSIEDHYLVMHGYVPMIQQDGRPLLKSDGSIRSTPIEDRNRLLQNNSAGIVAVTPRTDPSGPQLGAEVIVISRQDGAYREGAVLSTGVYEHVSGHCELRR